MQQGGTTQEEVMQLILMYAQITGDNPEEIMQEIEGMSPEKQGETIQQIQQAVQSAMSQQQGPGGMQQPGMARGGSYSGTYDAGTGSYFSHGGSYGRRLRMAQNGYEIPQRPAPEDYPDYGSFKLADDDWMMTYGEGAINVPDIDQQLASYDVGYENPAANILASGSPMAPVPVPTAAVTTTGTTTTEHPADYNYSIVDYLNSKGLPSSYSARKDIAKILNIPDYNRTDVQNVKMLQTLISNPNILQTIISNKPKGSNSTSKAIKNIRKKAEAQGAIVGGGGSGSTGFTPPPIVSDSTRTVVTDSTGKPVVITDSTKNKIDSLAGKPRNDFGFRDTTKTSGGGRPENKPKPSSPGTTAMDVVKTLGAVGLGAGLTYMYARMTAPQRVDQILKALYKNPNFVQASDNLKNQMLEKAVADVEAVYQSYKKMPKQQQAILDNLDAMEIPGYYPGEDVGDPVARAEALFAEQEAIQERQAMSRYADQEAADANAEAELERRIESQYANADAKAGNAEALAEQKILDELALRRSGVSPSRTKTILRNQRATQNMLDEAAAEEAAYQQFLKSKMVKAPVKAGPTSGTTSLRQRLLSGIQNRMPVGRPSIEARPEIRGQVPEVPSRLGQAGKFLRGLFKEVGKKEYGGAYVPDYSMAYGGMYAMGGGEDFCTDPMTGQLIDCETLRRRQMNRSYTNKANMMQMNSSNPYYNMNPRTGRIDTGGVRMNPYHEQVHSSYPPYIPNQNVPIPPMRRMVPRGMYGGAMAQGGQMPQWLAERRFAAAGNQDKMSSYGYQQGGVVEVDEANLPQFLQQLKQGGYQFEIMR